MAKRLSLAKAAADKAAADLQAKTAADLAAGQAAADKAAKTSTVGKSNRTGVKDQGRDHRQPALITDPVLLQADLADAAKCGVSYILNLAQLEPETLALLNEIIVEHFQAGPGLIWECMTLEIAPRRVAIEAPKVRRRA